MEYSHPYSRYGQALVIVENNLNEDSAITHQHLQIELMKGLSHFRVKPSETYEGKEKVKFEYMTFEFLQNNKMFQSKGKPNEGIFLSPNIIASDKSAGSAWSGINAIMQKLNNENETNENLTMSLFAASAKFNNGKKSQSTPKASLNEVACAAITNTTPIKPCLVYRTFKGGKTERSNTTIIPDLPLEEMIKFISLFKSMRSDVQADLFIGKVYQKIKGKGTKQSVTYEPFRPKIFNGNFPNPPQSSALGSIALLGAIGEWAKKAEYWETGKDVLNSLENVPIYMISYGNAKVFSYNHFIIELAKENKLNSIIDAVYYTKLYNTDNRGKNKTEYQNFDLFSSRFLQMFNQPSFKDFLAFRAEYPYQLEILFTTYFIKMEKITPEIVQSAKSLGRWLNYAAYLAAKSENKNTKSEEFKKAKAKVLIELESSAFSARTGDALVFQVVRRAGLLSESDAPPEADIFVEKTCTGEIPLESARNLIIAFSRLRNKYEKPSAVDEAEETEDEIEDTSEYEENDND